MTPYNHQATNTYDAIGLTDEEGEASLKVLLPLLDEKFSTDTKSQTVEVVEKAFDGLSSRQVANAVAFLLDNLPDITIRRFLQSVAIPALSEEASDESANSTPQGRA